MKDKIIKGLCILNVILGIIVLVKLNITGECIEQYKLAIVYAIMYFSFRRVFDHKAVVTGIGLGVIALVSQILYNVPPFSEWYELVVPAGIIVSIVIELIEKWRQSE